MCNPTAVEEWKGGQLTRKNVYCAIRFSVVSVSGEHGTEWGTGRTAERGQANCQILLEFETAVLGDCGERLVDDEPGGDDWVGVAMKSTSGGMRGGKTRGGGGKRSVRSGVRIRQDSTSKF